MFELGLTSAASLANLAAAIVVGRSGVPFTGSTDGSALILTSQLAGPIGNGITGSADGRISTASGFISGGGGYQFRSVQGLDGIGQIHTTQYDAFITGEGSATPNSVKIQFKFRLTTGVGTYQDITYFLDTEGVYWNHSGLSKYSKNSSAEPQYPITGYTILANPYSFAAFDGSEDAGHPWARRTSIFACAPYVPTDEGFVGNQKAFFVASTGVRSKTWYVSGAAQLNAAPYTVVDTRSYIRLLALRSPGSALLGTNNAPISTNAWVMFGRNALDQQVVVGKLWDCAIVGDQVGGGLILDGKQFTRVSQIGGSGNRTPSSLVFRVPSPNQEP
jgi:hypothetical protein